jgi:hypothetical protein
MKSKEILRLIQSITLSIINLQAIRYQLKFSQILDSLYKNVR